jgi:HD-GYP domain-containing protein (c-di-GMP phosphodiesterase class II)
MAKYIDLLREHQNKATNSPAEAKPSSKKKASEAVTEEELTSLMADESEFTEDTSTTTPDSFAGSELLAEEGDHQTSDETTQQESDSTFQSVIQPPAPEQAMADPTSGTDISVWLLNCTQEVSRLFKAASIHEAADLHPLILQLNIILEHLSKDDKNIDKLELEISRREKQVAELDSDLGSLIQKSIMMMLYAVKMGHRLKLNTDELRSHILAAIVHHIGMAQIPEEIRNKKEKLSKDEIEEIRTASKKSYDYLMLCNVTDATVLQAASQAQERYDGSGPQGLTGSEIAYSARSIGLLSMFEALIHYRPYRNRLLPRDAIRELVNHHKKAFDERLLKALIESISLYPVGTYVQLNSGDVGLVIQVNPRLPLRPIVCTMFDSHGDAINPREIDLQKQPNLMVQRCMYEEGLQELKESAGQGAQQA